MKKTAEKWIARKTVEGAVKGNNACMGKILEHYRGLVFRISSNSLNSFGRGYDYQATEDVTQETLIDIAYAIRHYFMKYWENYKKKKQS